MEYKKLNRKRKCLRRDYQVYCIQEKKTGLQLETRNTTIFLKGLSIQEWEEVVIQILSMNLDPSANK